MDINITALLGFVAATLGNYDEQTSTAQALAENQEAHLLVHDDRRRIGRMPGIRC